MLPERYFEDDRRFIVQQLKMLSAKRARYASRKYSEVYLTVLVESEGKMNKESLARRAANTRLREYVEKAKR